MKTPSTIGYAKYPFDNGATARPATATMPSSPAGRYPAWFSVLKSSIAATHNTTAMSAVVARAPSQKHAPPRASSATPTEIAIGMLRPPAPPLSLPVAAPRAAR